MKKRSNEATNADASGAKKNPPVKEQRNLQTRQALEHLDHLESKAAALLQRIKSKSDVPTLRRAIKLLEQAVDAAPLESSRHGMAVTNLCSVLGVLYKYTRDNAVLRRAGDVAAHWIKTIPDGDWRQPLYLLAGSMIAYHVACATGLEADEEDAIKILETTRSLVKPGAGVFCTSSSLLAELLLKRYERTWDVRDLEACLNHADEVFDAPRARIEERQKCCEVFVQAMLRRYEALGSVGDLDAAIKVIEMSLKNNLSREEKAGFYCAMGTALRFRFHVLRDQADLDRAIDCCGRAMKEASDDTVRAIFMDNYANELADRYHLTHNLADLHDAIASSRAALDLLPEESPEQARILANLGQSLFDMYAATRDSANLFKEVEILRRGLEYSTTNLSVLQRLHAKLAQALLHTAVISPEPGNLIREALDHFAKVREINNSQGEHLIRASLLARERIQRANDLEVGALLWQSELDFTSAPELLRRAIEVGEGEKSQSLATDLARRPLPRPADVPEELFKEERFWLGQLSGLDNIEIAGVPWEYQLRNMGRREDIQRELNSIWANIAKASPAGMRYVQMRHRPVGAWLDTVHQLDRNTAVLSLLPIRNVRTGNVFEARGLVVLGITPGRAEPFIIAKNLLLDPVPSAARQFEAEVPGDGGLGVRLETWHRPLQALLGNHTPDLIKQARTIIVSPPRDGHNLPWNLVLQRAGWRARDGSILPVITLPTLAILAPVSTPSGAEAGEQNKPLPKRMGYFEPRSADEALKQILRAARGWSGPLVAGNPTKDLPAAAREARAAAAILGVKPLIGRKVTTETVLTALDHAPIIHLAAHASFDERDPLESRILVADGTISAKDLVRSFCEAELVVLSSCEGGTASRVIGGEVAGLGYALLRAGARVVLASLWPVDDDATAFLMAEFYRARLSGVGEAAALAKAMRVTSEQPLWKHPYFWSGFVLMQGA